MGRKKKGGILATRHTRTINKKRYNSNIGYTWKSRAKQEAKTARKTGKYKSVVVKPYTLKDVKGKKKK